MTTRVSGTARHDRSTRPASRHRGIVRRLPAAASGYDPRLPDEPRAPLRTCSLLPLLLPFALPAQTTWNVAPPANLDAVFAAAAPGDLVLLAWGTYRPFTLTKGLVVIGPATIQGATGPVGPWDTDITIPAGQHAALIGLDFQPTQQPGAPVPLSGNQVTVTGSASFEDCSFGTGVPHSLVVTSGEVVLQHCTVRGGPGLGGGFRQAGGYCSMSGSTVEGLDAGSFGGPFTILAQPGATIDGGTFTASHTTFRGGNASRDNGISRAPAPALAGSGATTRVFLADSTATGGTGIAGGANLPGAPAVTSSTGQPVLHARTNLAGGMGTVPGPASTGNVAADPQIVGLAIDHGLWFGSTSTATAIAGSAALLAVLATLDHAVTAHPAVVEPLFGLQAQAVTVVVAVPAAGGAVPVAIVVPNTLALRGVALWLQALQWSSAAWRASAVAGGPVH